MSSVGRTHWVIKRVSAKYHQFIEELFEIGGTSWSTIWSVSANLRSQRPSNVHNIHIMSVGTTMTVWDWKWLGLLYHHHCLSLDLISNRSMGVGRSQPLSLLKSFLWTQLMDGNLRLDLLDKELEALVAVLKTSYHLRKKEKDTR